MFAQALIETGLLDSLSDAFSTVVSTVESSFETHPWLWIAGLTIFLLLMMRPRK
jgi:hypothetical protein